MDSVTELSFREVYVRAATALRLWESDVQMQTYEDLWGAAIALVHKKYPKNFKFESLSDLVFRGRNFLLSIVREAKKKWEEPIEGVGD